MGNCLGGGGENVNSSLESDEKSTFISNQTHAEIASLKSIISELVLYDAVNRNKVSIH
jgi:hypothetical protein